MKGQRGAENRSEPNLVLLVKADFERERVLAC